MANVIRGLLNGLVIETDVTSLTGPCLYSDFATSNTDASRNKDTVLNALTPFPIIGIAAGVTRVALAIIHIIGHLLAALFLLKKGHLYHAAKGVCEIFRGVIETIPLVGRLFSLCYVCPCVGSTRSWWMIKIYNPQAPDGLDRYMNNWQGFTPRFYFRG